MWPGDVTKMIRTNIYNSTPTTLCLNSSFISSEVWTILFAFVSIKWCNGWDNSWIFTVPAMSVISVKRPVPPQKPQTGAIFSGAPCSWPGNVRKLLSKRTRRKLNSKSEPRFGGFFFFFPHSLCAFCWTTLLENCHAFLLGNFNLTRQENKNWKLQLLLQLHAQYFFLSQVFKINP